jgi:diacylglycerol O-acyltransferase
MDRLSGIDGAFLSLESPTTHLHILGVLIFDPTGVAGGVGFDRVRALVASRLPLVPPFRQRMMPTPLGINHPVLVDDPEFDLDFHVRRASLPAPGGREELEDLAADLASRPLDRRRPLWEFHVVEGVSGDRIALIPKVHHSIIDGVSAAEVMAAFFDLSPEPAPQPLFTGRSSAGWSRGSRAASHHDPSWAPEPFPGELARWRDVLSGLPGTADGMVRTVSRTFRSVRERTQRPETKSTAPASPFDVPRTSINRAISPHRRVALAELPLEDVHRVRRALGGTVNDIVLTVVGGAMQRFFTGRGEDPDGSLVALVPVSVRAEIDRAVLGNQISALLVSLATELDDPSARLTRLGEEMRAAKEWARQSGSELLAGWAHTMVPAVVSRLTRLVTNARLFDHVAPFFNLIVSNVPGPDVPLFLAGARLEAAFPLGPIIEGAGLNVTVFSYLDSLFVGVTGCWDLVPDIEAVTVGMHDALAELVALANQRDRPIPWWHAEVPA